MKGTVDAKRAELRNHALYDIGVTRVSALAAVLLVVSIIVTGIVAYSITKSQAVKKLKENDLAYIASSIAAKIDGSIERAVETSRLLAEDRAIRDWIRQGERLEAGADPLAKIVALKQKFGYDNSFIVSVPTGRYYAENGALIDVMSRNDPDDSWYYSFLQENNPTRVEIDYNHVRQDTFIFVNAFMKDGSDPLAIVGVGLSLKELSAKFGEYKYGANGSLWLTDQTGTIYLSDDFGQNGHNIRDFIPAATSGQVLADLNGKQSVLDFRGPDGRMNDLVTYPIAATDWTLVVSVDRAEATSFLRTIQVQTAAAVAVALLFVIFFFYYTSRKLAEPYKRAIGLNMELENQIAARTQELAEQNEKLLDSLDYASRIQQSALPAESELGEAFADHFVLWRPKDVVGGDFVWVKPVQDGHLVAVGDCTGHGVPGALMSIMTVSLLNQFAQRDSDAEPDPSRFLAQLNQSIKMTLHQKDKDGLTDDGLDIGLVYVTRHRAVFAGAKFTLYIRGAGGVQEIEGSRKSVGYRNTPNDYAYTSAMVNVDSGDELFLTSDGLIDQNGGEKNYSFGKSRWRKWLETGAGTPMSGQKQHLESVLQSYRGDEPQRDDITVVGLRLL
ncbi:SpoIIE family protein phosphatase [Paenibacillus ginsengarvi]|nr:SpoIIE family protein phosphatase [Paenibacillus ginsengarvi]